MVRTELDISEGDCRVIAARTDALCDAGVFADALEDVSPYRRTKVLSYRFEKDRRLSLLAGMLLDELLRNRGLRERDMTYVEGENGKPSFGGCATLHFSLAHSGDLAVAALADAPIGVDVEQLPVFPDDIADPHTWTALESVGKLLGCGMGPFVDGDGPSVPSDITIKHIELDEYLVCIARKTDLPCERV